MVYDRFEDCHLHRQHLTFKPIDRLKQSLTNLIVILFSLSSLPPYMLSDLFSLRTRFLSRYMHFFLNAATPERDNSFYL